MYAHGVHVCANIYYSIRIEHASVLLESDGRLSAGRWQQQRLPERLGSRKKHQGYYKQLPKNLWL